jgi:hypothetical protein
MHALREIDGLVYVLSASASQDDPVVVRDFYPTGIPASVARRNLGVDQLDGLPLRPGRGGHYEIVDPSLGRVEVVLERGGHTTSSFSDEISVPAPITRRRGRVSWHQGTWVISGKRRLEAIAGESSIITSDIVMAPPLAR